MNKLLTRILTGLVAVLIALSLFSFLVLSLTNQVRYEHYWSSLLTPGMKLVARDPTLAHGHSGSNLSLVARNQNHWGEVLQARLDGGQVVVHEDVNRLIALVATPEPSLAMRLTTRKDGEEVYRFYMGLISVYLNRLEPGQAHHRAEASGSEVVSLGAHLESLADTLNLELELLGEESQPLSEPALESLSARNVYFKKIKGSTEAYIRLQRGEVLRIHFPSPFSELSWFVIGLLVAFSVFCLGITVYFMLQGLDRQLRNVETVASRIARGELDARVRRASDADAVSRLGTAFNSMADHIQRLMYIQKEMIHAVSHELRTPVARIRFGVQMIEDCPDKDSLRKQLKGIDGDIQELDELIDEILTYARLEQGGPILAFHDTNVVKIVEQVVSEQSGVKPEMEISSEYNADSELWKDSEVEARYIHRSIQNLVGNATRYAKSRVKVVCSFDKETCRIDVEDDGPGIPEEDWESVFTPFARLDDSRTRSSGGYGLGLAIVRRILYWHGGQAFLGSSAMGGAKFSLVWPRKQQAPQ